MFKKITIFFFSLLFLTVSLLPIDSNNHVEASSSYAFYDLGTWPVVGPGYRTTGGFVGAVQSNLWATGYSSEVGSVDSSYGPATQNGVKKFQTRYGLTADGFVGPATWRKMEDFTYNYDTWTRRYLNPNDNYFATAFHFYANGTGTSYQFILHYKNQPGSHIRSGFMWAIY